MPLTIGDTFAGYQVLRLLGAGGMGEVYLAQHPRLPRQEALKVLRADYSQDESFRERFIREADLASGLRHPHVVGIHDRGEHNSQLWIAMDYIDGSDLSHLLARRYPQGMPVGHVLPIVNAVASALDYAHKKGLLHRDIKPANIIVADLDTDDPKIYLADFGIARPLDDTSGITTTNMTVGTVAYAAPEQLMGEDMDGRADQYALAATTYHLLTGSQLFPNSNPAVVISRHLNTSPPNLADSKAALAGLDSVLRAALAKDPHDRYPSCSSFAHAITQVAEPMLLAASEDTTVGPAGQPRTTKVADPAPIGIQDAAGPVSATAPTGYAQATPTPQLRDRPYAAEQSPDSRFGSRGKLALVAGAVILLIAVVSAVVFLNNPSSGSGQQASSGSTSVRPTTSGRPTTAASPSTVDTIANLLPPAIRQSGKLVIGVNVPYAPAEFLDNEGRLAGFDVDLMNAIARTLGLAPDYRQVDFAEIFPAVQDGTLDVGMSAFTDSKQREQYVDFVTYFSAGTLWARPVGSSIRPEDACGARVAVQATTVQETDELPARSNKCIAEGRPAIHILSFYSQDAATNAVVLGQADAMTADSAVTSYVIKQTGGHLEPAGKMFDTAPFGWPMTKGSMLAEAMKTALEQIMETGEYMDILTNWGVESGAIQHPVINGAVS